MRMPFVDEVWRQAFAAAWGPKIGVTREGRFGRFPKETGQRDEIWLLKGYDRPIILRKIEGYCIYIGPAYIVEPLFGRTKDNKDQLKAKVCRINICCDICPTLADIQHVVTENVNLLTG